MSQILIDALAALTVAYGIVEADLFAGTRMRVVEWLEDRDMGGDRWAEKLLGLLGCVVCAGFWGVGVRYLPGPVVSWLASAGVIVFVVRFMPRSGE